VERKVPIDSVFSQRDRVGKYALRRFTQSYDLFGNQLMTPGEVFFESVRRFKGQQAPAVVLVDVDPSREKPETFTRLLYSGMTRATVRLELLVKMDNPLNEAYLGVGWRRPGHTRSWRGQRPRRLIQ